MSVTVENCGSGLAQLAIARTGLVVLVAVVDRALRRVLPVGDAALALAHAADLIF